MELAFGHHLGLPGAVKGLPVAPLVPRYRLLATQLSALRLRHIGETLVRPGEQVRVLDGVFVRSPRRGWQHVDRDRLHQMRAGRPDSFAPLLTHLADMHDQDPAALRRVLLYQLITLMQEHPQGPLPSTAVSLGVSTHEAAALAHAVSTRSRPGPEQRTAAEALGDEWALGRVRSAARMAARLPADGADDQLLAHRMASVACRVRRADAALAEAHAREGAGDTGAAGAAYLRAAQLTGDCPDALRGLIRMHRPAERAPGRVTVQLGPDSLQVNWPGAEATRAPGTPSWRLIRLTRRPGGDPEPAEVQAGPEGVAWVDTAPPFGREVRYAALPLRGSRIAGPPLVSKRLVVAPEVSGLRVVDGRARIEVRWRQPSAALGVLVRLTAPDGSTREIVAAEERFVVDGLKPGRHLLRLNCRYLANGGEEVASAGISRTVTVHPWPSPVSSLGATARDGRAHFTWTGGAGARVRLVEWPGEPPPPGTELRTAPDSWPAPLEWETSAGGLVPPPGIVTRVTALAILGERAVVGPGLRIEAPHPVTAAMAQRLPGGLARVTFDWPPATSEVNVVLDQDGHSVEHRVTRSLFLREGLTVPVSPSPLSIQVTSAPRTRDTTAIAPAPARTALTAEIVVAYRIVPGPRRLLRRGPATVRVTLSSPEGELLNDMPEFVLVARGAEGRAPVRPRDHVDGTTVFRLSGDELHRAGTVERELPPDACRPPYVLRGFLLGDRAAEIRLDDPSPTTLVVH